MSETFREYRDCDYSECEELVNQAWGFDQIFSSQELSKFAKHIYTKGSCVSSNYRMVVEDNGRVAGFIFGLNTKSSKPGRNIIFGLGILWKLMRLKGDKSEKRKLIDAINHHQKNRYEVVDKGRSEIVLFVVSKEYQGKGVGKRLWSYFKKSCIDSGVDSVIVETNKLGASSFYERIGFVHLSNFDSPLHELATEGGQACMYEYKCK